MNRIREIDANNNTMTVEAGCILDNVHTTAAEANLMFPLTLASSGSCMIGGNLGANAGGTSVLRYGTAGTCASVWKWSRQMATSGMACINYAKTIRDTIFETSLSALREHSG